MPTSTFFSLPEEKRSLILAEALKEFADHPLEQASLSHMVTRLQIAKGSMYQYFKNKQDLYGYVLQLCYEKKREYLKEVFTKERDFFSLVRFYYQRAYLFARAYPQEHRVIRNFWDSKDERLKTELRAYKELRYWDFQGYLKEALAQGQIHATVSKDASFFVYHSVGKELVESFLDAEQKEDEYLRFIEEVLLLLQKGLQKREGERS